MKQHTPILLALSLLLLASLACNTLLPSAEPTAYAPPVSQGQNPIAPVLQSEDQVPRISVEQAKAAYDSGQAIIVDVRATESYLDGHAAGSVSIPLDRFEININTVPLQKQEWIVTYCT